MGATKRLFEKVRQEEVRQELLDADYQYEQFMRENYPQHFNNNQQQSKRQNNGNKKIESNESAG